MNPRLLLSCLTLIAGCTEAPPAALGTIERDRIELPATVAERITAIAVHEGQRVAAGELILELDDAPLRGQLDAAEADATRLQNLLDEARNGPRTEQRARARAQLAAAMAQADRARRERARIEPLVAGGVLSASQGDAARAADQAAHADVRAQRAVLDELEAGTRPETVAQAESALAAALARVAVLRLEHARTRLVAPRAGVVDSLPFEVGDQRPIGTPLATLVLDAAPHARVYVPQGLRASFAPGGAVTVQVAGDPASHGGRVRALRTTPSFTPYYALQGDDVSRLVWLAEIELGADARQLADGMPVAVRPASPAAPR